MKTPITIFGPEVPNYALLNEAAKGKSGQQPSAAEVRASKKICKPRKTRLDAKLPS